MCLVVFLLSFALSFCLQESEEDDKLPAMNLLICLVARFVSKSEYLITIDVLDFDAVLFAPIYTNHSVLADTLSRMTWQISLNKPE